MKTTGCGLPAGPFGLIGAAEGISYLVVIGFVAAAVLSKVFTGRGLPAGPLGLLGGAVPRSNWPPASGPLCLLLPVASLADGDLFPGVAAAEGLSFVTAAAGLAVLGFQLSDYGYLPEAVPVEGGVCSNI